MKEMDWPAGRLEPEEKIRPTKLKEVIFHLAKLISPESKKQTKYQSFTKVEPEVDVAYNLEVAWIIPLDEGMGNFSPFREIDIAFPYTFC